MQSLQRPLTQWSSHSMIRSELVRIKMTTTSNTDCDTRDTNIFVPNSLLVQWIEASILAQSVLVVISDCIAKCTQSATVKNSKMKVMSFINWVRGQCMSVVISRGNRYSLIVICLHNQLTRAETTDDREVQTSLGCHWTEYILPIVHINA